MDEIRAARARLGLSRQSLAELLGVNTATIWRWETGRTRVPGAVRLALVELERQSR